MAVRVFVVDDTDHVRRMLVQMLELSEFDVVGSAQGCKEALEALEHLDPQVIVVDYKMPGIDGIECARRIRTNRPGQAIILNTAYLDRETQRLATEAGIAICVGKVEGLATLERDIRRLAGDMFAPGEPGI